MLNRLSSFKIISLSFLLLIFLGTVLLMLPVATNDGRGAPLLTALFTTVSASCVTGLTVENTALYWSHWGQAVILVLIQIGGLGVVTMAVALTMASGKRIDLRQRSTIQEAWGCSQLGGIVRILRFVLKLTVGMELLGAALLAPVFCRDYGLLQGAWMALFHAVSAFCNAGFDLMGERGGGSLMAYAGDPVVNLVIIGLIISGGLGFITWADLYAKRWHWKQYQVQTKIILCMTAGLILLPATLLFFRDLAAEPLQHRLFMALFQAVTPRTAGFNTMDIESLTEAGRIVLVGLMLTGGAPGSTAGGVKVTTAFVLMASAVASLRMKTDIACFKRRIAPQSLQQAVTIFLLYLGLFAGSTFLISEIDAIPVIDCMVETSSALGTVGLSIGLTEHLSVASQLILIGLMYFGRVGALTMIYTLNNQYRPNRGRLPEEKITVG